MKKRKYIAIFENGATKVFYAMGAQGAFCQAIYHAYQSAWDVFPIKIKDCKTNENKQRYFYV